MSDCKKRSYFRNDFIQRAYQKKLNENWLRTKANNKGKRVCPSKVVFQYRDNYMTDFNCGTVQSIEFSTHAEVNN